MGKLILVGDLEAPALKELGRTVVCARVSSFDQRADLGGQVARVVAWATEHGHFVEEVISEVGSALNGNRRKFLALLRDRPGPVLSLRSRLPRASPCSPGSSSGRRGPLGGRRRPRPRRHGALTSLSARLWVRDRKPTCQACARGGLRRSLGVTLTMPTKADGARVGELAEGTIL
jgi:hypothetical protein